MNQMAMATLSFRRRAGCDGRPGGVCEPPAHPPHARRDTGPGVRRRSSVARRSTCEGWSTPKRDVTKSRSQISGAILEAPAFAGARSRRDPFELRMRPPGRPLPAAPSQLRGPYSAQIEGPIQCSLTNCRD